MIKIISFTFVHSKLFIVDILYNTIKMKLDFDERIIRKAGFASGGPQFFGMSFNNILNLYLTNKRLYAEIMLIHKCAADIPLNSITSLEFMETLTISLPVVVYNKNKKERKFYFYVHSDLNGWIEDLSNNLKRYNTVIAPKDMKSNTSYHLLWIGAVLFAVILFALTIITPEYAEKISFIAGCAGALVAIIVITMFVKMRIRK